MISHKLASNIERLRSSLAWRLGWSIDLLESAEGEIIDPGHVVTGNPCIALPGEFDKILSCAFELDLKTEIAQLQGAPRPIGATRKYLLKNVIVRAGVIYLGGRRLGFNSNIPGGSTSDEWQELSEVGLRSSLVGCHFFGHWLRDDCATHILAQQIGTTISMPTPEWPDRGGYAKKFDQHYSEVQNAHIKRLHLFDDIHQNNEKARRLSQLRKAFPKETLARERIVYLMRGAGGTKRSVTNEQQLVEALLARGVTILQAEALDLRQLWNELNGADVVISVEGSQLSHALFTLKENGGVLAIQPPDRFFNSHFDWARALGMHYGIVVGTQKENGFEVSATDVLRTLDLLLARIQ